MQCKQTGGNNFCTAQIQKVHCSNVCIAQTEDSNVSIAQCTHTVIQQVPSSNACINSIFMCTTHRQTQGEDRG